MFDLKSLQGLDKQSASAFIQLLKKILKRETTLYLGAGVSASSGIPTWNQLIEGICSTFFFHWEYLEITGNNKIPKNLSIAFWENFFWSDKSKELSKILGNENPINVAEQIKSRIRPADWIYLIRKLLYYQNELKPSTLISEIADLFSKEYINTVITSNYDDLLEKQLKLKGVKCKSIAYKPFNRGVDKVVIHPHGILPVEGGEKTKIILTESDYIEEFSKPYSWTNLTQLSEFNQSTCLFIGVSFTDINLVKLLRISRTQTKNMHFAFIFDVPDKDEKLKELFYTYLYDLGIKVIRIPMKNNSDFGTLPIILNRINEFISNENHELRKYTN